MTEADLQLSQLFHAAAPDQADAAFAGRVMEQVARERRRALTLRLVLQLGGLAVFLALAVAARPVMQAFSAVGFSGLGQTATLAVCLTVVAGVLSRPLLARMRA